MGIGLSGMISGMDTDSIVKALVSAQRTKATKIENKITLNKWTTDAWSSLNTKIYSFYTKYASKLRMQSTYLGRKASSSNEAIAKATASTSAAVGTHTLQVRQLASSQYVTGRQLSKKAETYNRNTKLTELGVDAGTIVTIKGKKGTSSEKEVKLEIGENTTIDDFLKACKEAGVNATFDLKQQRFFLNSAQSGAEDAFSITTSQLSAGAEALFKGIDDSIDKSKLSASEKTSYENAMATLRQNTDLISNVLDSSFDYEKADKKQKAVYDAIETVKNTSVNQYANETATKKITDADLLAIQNGAGGTFELYGTTYDYAELHKKAEENLETGYRYQATKDAMAALKDVEPALDKAIYADPEKITYAHVQSAEEVKKTLEDAGTINSSTDLTDIDALKAAGVTDEQIEQLKVLNTLNYTGVDTSGNPIDVQAAYQNGYNTAKGDATEHAERVQNGIHAAVLEDQDNMEKYNEAIAKEEADLLADTSNVEINELKSLIETNLSNAAAAGSTASTNGLAALGLGEIDGNAVAEGAAGSNGMVVIAAADADFVLDGVSMTETSNNFTVNGLTLDLISTSYNKDDPSKLDTIQITVGKDASATYDFIKEAITEYNKLIEEMNTLYNAKSARGYDPLTSEQKEAMSESDIEAWEKKIKDSLLRRDDTLGGLLTGMRTALSTTYTNADGKTFSLSTFGIVTGNYTEYGKLHIYGDEDDSTYADYNDRLKTALEEDPENVMNALSGIFGNLYTTMQEKCAAKKDISSALTFYNDKSYNKALEGYEKDLKKMEEKIKDLEDRYYKQFTAMETALAKLQSQTNSLAAMLGNSSGQ